MGLMRICFVLLLFFLLLGIATPSFLKYDRMDDSPGEEGRSLLPRGPADCPFDVENMNYKIVTSQCKREPNYNAKICCTSFKKLTCKYRDDLNSNPNACATEMFYYLRRYGNYPAGLFLTLCKEGNNGLDCLGY